MLHVATTSAWICNKISIIAVRVRSIVSSLRNVVEDNVLIQTLIRGIVEGAIIGVKLVTFVSMECAITHKVFIY